MAQHNGNDGAQSLGNSAPLNVLLNLAFYAAFVVPLTAAKPDAAN